MDCDWIPFEDKFKCSRCGFVVAKQNTLKNCRPPQVKPLGPKSPNIMRKAINLSKASAEHISKGRQHCSTQERQTRLDICQSNQCGLFIKNSNNGGGVCSHDDCGCTIRTQGKFLDKLSWASSKCPEGHWGPIDEKNS